MAQQTQLGVMATPGRVQTFSAKTAADVLTLLEPVQVAGGHWVVRWTSTSSGPFWVYRDGVLLTITYLKRVNVYTEGDAESVLMEVLTSAEETPASAESARQQVRWAGVSGSVEYKVERNIDAVWTELGRVRHNGASVYGYRSDTLDDDAQHQFRVRAIDTAGKQSGPLELSRYAVRHPDPPDDATIVYDESSGKIAVENMV